MFETAKIKSGDSLIETIYLLPKQHNDKIAFVLPGYVDTKDYPHIKKLLVALAHEHERDTEGDRTPSELF